MIEIEIKLPLYKRSITERGLVEAGFVPGDLVRESDIYFTSDFHDFMKSDEALRIRSSDNLTRRESHTYLTYKGRKLDQVSMTRKELETEISSADEMRDIFLALGYRHLFPVTKLRQYYHLDRITACVDQVEGLGSFLELEILAAGEEDREEALQVLAGILKQLDYGMEDTTRVSYLSMLLKKNGHPVL